MAQVFDSTEIRQNLRQNVPPSMRDAYDKVVAAGMKIMFDPKTHRLMLEQLQGDGPLADKLATGTTSLMSMLLQNSKGAFPGQLIIPAGIELMLHAADFLAQGPGEPIDAETLGSAIQKFVFGLFEQAGVKPDMLMAGVDRIQQLNGQPQEAPPGAQQAQGQEQMPPQPQQGAGGLLTQPQGV